MIHNRKGVGLNKFNHSKHFIKYLIDMNDKYKIDEKYNLDKQHKISIEFNDTIVDMLSKKRLNIIVTEVIIQGAKLTISLVFIPNCFCCTKKNH